MKGKSAEINILNFLKENYVWHSSAELQRMRFANKDGTWASPKAISRRLQELAEGENAVIDVDYGNKNHAHYRIKQAHRKVRQVVEETENGVRVSYLPV